MGEMICYWLSVLKLLVHGGVDERAVFGNSQDESNEGTNPPDTSPVFHVKEENAQASLTLDPQAIQCVDAVSVSQKRD